MQFTLADFTAIAPQVILVVTALFVLLLHAFIPRLSSRWLANLTLLGLAGAGLAVAQLWPGIDAEPALQGMVSPDLFNAYFSVVFLIGAALSVMLGVQYTDREKIGQGEYYALMLFAVTGMMILSISVNLITIFIGIEVLSIALYVLAGYQRERLASQEAALKYFLLGAYASAFLVYGIALTYGATGTLAISEIVESIAQLAEPGKNFLLLAGVALMLVGFAFKIAAVPFHIWAPDVYEGAPTPVTAFMSVGVKAAAFAALLRVFIGCFESQFPGQDLTRMISAVLASVAALTMLLGNVVAVIQPNFKRMIAYSSIAHAGYMLLGVVASVRSSDMDGAAAVLFYSLVYTFANLGAFGVLLAFQRRGEEIVEIKDLAGLAYRYPALGVLMTLFMLSLAGFPLTGGFIGKFYLFRALLDPQVYGLTWLAIVAVLTSVVSFYYYLGVVRTMYMERPEDPEDQPESRRDLYLNLSLGVAAAGTLILGLVPASFLQAATRAAYSITDFVQQAMR